MFLGVLGCTFHTQSASFLSTAMHHSPPSGNPELRVCVIPTVVFSDFEVLIPFLANGFCHSLTSLAAGAAAQVSLVGRPHRSHSLSRVCCAPPSRARAHTPTSRAREGHAHHPCRHAAHTAAVAGATGTGSTIPKPYWPHSPSSSAALIASLPSAPAPSRAPTHARAHHTPQRRMYAHLAPTLSRVVLINLTPAARQSAGRHPPVSRLGPPHPLLSPHGPSGPRTSGLQAGANRHCFAKDDAHQPVLHTCAPTHVPPHTAHIYTGRACGSASNYGATRPTHARFSLRFTSGR